MYGATSIPASIPPREARNVCQGVTGTGQLWFYTPVAGACYWLLPRTRHSVKQTFYLTQCSYLLELYEKDKQCRCYCLQKQMKSDSCIGRLRPGPGAALISVSINTLHLASKSCWESLQYPPEVWMLLLWFVYPNLHRSLIHHEEGQTHGQYLYCPVT